MRIIDGHCDVLYKMQMNRAIDFHKGSPDLEVTLPRLIEGEVKLQCYAIYLSEALRPYRYHHILECVDLFYQKVLLQDQVRIITTKEDLYSLCLGQQIGAILTLEGVDGLEGSLMYLRNLYQLGVRSVGLTWNYGNWAADGVKEPRNGGLTLEGRKLVEECKRMGMILDISHLNERGFWELLGLPCGPIMASHSNAFSICPHVRNLKDEQVKAIIQKNGIIGVTFVPSFLTNHEQATITDIIRHIDYICSLGGMYHIGFGSDFDGVGQWVQQLEHPGMMQRLTEELGRYYNDEHIQLFLFGNWYRFWTDFLPSSH